MTVNHSSSKQIITERPSFGRRILQHGFRRYVRRFIRRNFNAVRISNDSYFLDNPQQGPVVCFANHPSWWDPMTAVLITDCFFPNCQFYAPIDADALKQYPILEKLGFFPVAQRSTAATKQFLSQSRNLLSKPNSILWLTPTGVFCDVRQSAPFKHGLAQIIDRQFAGTLFTMAVEYTFWNERYPELLITIRPPIDCQRLSSDRTERTQAFEQELSQAQASLSNLAITRDPTKFHTILTGNSGIGGWYDWWRATLAQRRGGSFHLRHQPEPLSTQPHGSGEPNL